ncbi:MAG TPA: DUF1080 domain-containing protein [Chitinophagaceae bacterium]|nr:DUF1080 domain-containing protein [Chitinophagaceae bacterium]
MNRKNGFLGVALTLASLSQALPGLSQNIEPTWDLSRFRTSLPPENKTMKPEETEFYTPVPPVVTPGDQNSQPPSDAIVLFDGSNLDQWSSVKDGSPAGWTVGDGIFTVKPGTGSIQTKQSFEDYQLHIEWRSPAVVKDSGQGRGNSGVFLASTGPGDDGYELQVLDSYQSPTYTNGQAGSIYKQYPPLVNACRPPGVWQTYDVIWTAPRFNPDGSLKSPARLTAIQNGVLIQNNSVLWGTTLYIGHPFYSSHGPSPLKLQDHHCLVSYRNIWIRKL